MMKEMKRVKVGGMNAEFSNQKSAEKVFNFITCQKNTDTWKTDVEWSLQDYSGNSDNVSILYTTREEGSVNGTYYKAAKMADRGYVLNRSIHNHSTNDPTPSPGDYENKANLKELSPNSKFQIQTKHGRTSY